MKTFIILVALVLSSCSSVKNIDSSMIEPTDLKGKVGDRNLGIKDGEIVLQEKSAADDELRIAENVNMTLRDSLRHEEHMLQWCRTDLSDTRLGGTGVLPEPIQNDIDTAPVSEEKMGLVGEDESLVVVKTTNFKTQLIQARKDKISLDKTISSTKRLRQECEYKLSSARQNAGLSPKRYGAQGYFTSNGGWVQIRKAEQSLDDAFEIAAEAKNAKPLPAGVVDMTH